MSKAHSLRISDYRRETPSAVSIAFDVPSNLKETFAFHAGQYLTLEALINGEKVRRAYSICSSPQSGELRVAIKEVENGLFSGYANQSLQVGDTLEVFPPEGRFVFDSDLTQQIGAIAAGSGITPILSIAKTVLDRNSESTFALLYGNKTQEESIFFDEIAALKETYGARFSLYQTYSREKQKEALFGRIDAGTINYMLKHFQRPFDAFYICGPEPMIRTVNETLEAREVPESNIFFELFTPAKPAVKEVFDGQNTQVTLVLDEVATPFEMRSSTTLLEAALSQKIEAPYSCQGGVCSTCIARITEGTAEMTQNQILTDSEVADGLVLTCQAHPTSATIKVDYDDV